MTTGKLVLKISVNCEGDENDRISFKEALSEITEQNGWYETNCIFIKEIDYNENTEVEIQTFNNFIESNYINGLEIIVDIKKYYKW